MFRAVCILEMFIVSGQSELANAAVLNITSL